MERQSLRRPRTHGTRKPRLGINLFVELGKVNGLHNSHKKDVPTKTPATPKKGAFLQEIVGPRKKVLAHDSSLCHNLQNGTSNTEEGTENEKFEASHRKDRQRGLHDLQPECFQETREGSQGGSESDTIGLPFVKQNVAGSKARNTVNVRDLDYLASQSLAENASGKPGLSSRIQGHRRKVVPKKFFDDDSDKDRCFGEKDNVVSRGQNNLRNVLNTEHVPKAELGKSSSRQFQNKVLKKGSPMKADESVYQSDEGTHLTQDVENWRESPSVARRHQRHIYSQEISPDKGNGQVYSLESSGEDANSGSNDQCFPDLEHTTHVNGNPASNVNERGELQVPITRKSSRIPKKRVFDDDDEAPLRRQRRRIQMESAADHAEQEDSTDGMGIEQLANECCERESTGMVDADHECHVRECLNSIDEPFQDEKKELPLTAQQRALRNIKEGGDPEVNLIAGFPNCLQPVLPKRQKENLTEAEQAIKKEEAARRRKQKMEKNAKEIQAVAIQKILGQESSRKKREEKLQKQRQDIEQVFSPL
ncbi:hypothetical protein L7F22_020943 [Adiantum nelumboides]|nr:hypothetical protein [Adiantum nelumboides]